MLLDDLSSPVIQENEGDGERVMHPIEGDFFDIRGFRLSGNDINKRGKEGSCGQVGLGSQHEEAILNAWINLIDGGEDDVF